MKALITLENIHNKLEQNPMKTLGETISNYLYDGQWRPDAGQWTVDEKGYN